VAAEIVMPRLSDSMEEGTILRWLKSVGDEVKRGDELVEIETDKANMVYEATDEGTLIEVLAQEGDTLPIGEIIARVGDAGEVKGDGKPARKEPTEPKAEEADQGEEAEAPDQVEEAAAAKPAEEAEEPRREERRSAAAAAPEKAAEPTPDGRVKASPIARRMAGELGVELARVEGSGPGGRIVKADVEAAAAGLPAGGPATPQPQTPSQTPTPSPAPAPARAAAAPAPETAKGEVETVELTKLQTTVARRMSESKATAPHFYLEMEIDMAAAVQMRAQLKEIVSEGKPAPTFNDMVVKACGLALREFPRANGAYRDGRFELYSRINVGVAVAAHDALVVPTIFDADQKSLGEIAEESRQLSQRVRDHSITPPELSGGTFTVSNLGMYGIENFSAVINPPQAALLSVGAVKQKPVVDDSGQIVARHMMGVTLACDHRILYGADGAEFLGRVRDLLQQPLSLSL
jgi:pyruvate dehydrogenase E2 component (dihydrolipoamide acetyltransferase)